MRRRIIPFVLALLVLVVGLAPAQQPPLRRYGLFIGANDGGRGRVTLRWAVSDAERVADVMTEIGGIRAQDAYLLTDPTGRDLELQFEHLRNRIATNGAQARRSEIVVYYSGHSDESGLMLGDDHLSYVELRRLIDDVGADVSIAILDSCASGAFTRLKGGSFTQPFLLDDGSDVTGHAFLASSSADEASQESDSLGSSFFTHYLVSGLRGAADASNDRNVTLDEVYLYAREETLQRTLNTFAGPQNASFDFQLTGTGSLVLTDLSVVDAAVVLDPSVAGRIFVRREIGGIVAEVDKREGNELTLALPAGRYVLTLQGDERNYEHDILLASGASVPVAGRDFRITYLDRNRVRGDEPSAVPLSLTILPGVDLVADDPYQVTFSLGLIAGQAYRVQGAQASGVISVIDESLIGVQAAGIGSTVGGDVRGVQSSGVFNIVNGDSFAIQNSGVFNRIHGRGGIVQNAGVFNVATGGFDGLQSAGVFNVTDGTLNGAQISGVFNRAAAANGVQLSLVNVGGEVNGTQIGLVNIGERVVGAQIGLVNISREMYGIPFGLANFVEEGIHDASIWWEGEDRTWIGVQNGSNIFYTLAYAGFSRGGEWRELEGFATGLALGFRVESRPFYLDVDAGWKRVTDGIDAQERFAALFDPTRGASFPSARIMAGVTIGGGLGWFMGGTFDMAGPLSIDTIGYFTSDANGIPFGGGLLYPKFFTGFKL
ncbi:MAG: caspase family protein [Spirochaetota bacterium]